MKKISSALFVMTLSAISLGAMAVEPLRPELFNGEFKVDLKNSDSDCLPKDAIDVGGPEDQYYVFQGVSYDRKGTGFVSFDSASRARPFETSLTGLHDHFDYINGGDNTIIWDWGCASNVSCGRRINTFENNTITARYYVYHFNVKGPVRKKATLKANTDGSIDYKGYFGYLRDKAIHCKFIKI